MKALIKLLLSVLCAFLFSCHQGESGRHRSRTVDEINYDLVQIPASELGQKKDNIADLMYYRLTISESGKKERIRKMLTPSNYNKLLFYVNNQISNDLETSDGHSSLLPVQVYFESQAKLSGKLVFMLAFEKFSETADNITVEFRDNIFNNGPVKFNYHSEDINTL